MSAWLKSIGVTGDPLPPDWYVTRADALRRTQFARRPNINVCDKLVYYAIGRGCVCGIVEVISPAVQGIYPDHWDEEKCSRWPWSVGVAPRLIISADGHAPTLADIGVDTLSVRRQSHIRLSGEQLDAAISKILHIALNDPDAARIEMFPR